MTTDDAATPPIHDPQSEIRNPSARIDFDLACVKCDRNLRTRPADGLCPGCATPISDSLRSDLLRFADVRWLGRIRNGMGVALWTPVVFFGISVAVIVTKTILEIQEILEETEGSSPTPQPFLGSSLALLFLLLSICFCVLMLWGLFLITTPDPNRPGRDRALRVWCRWLGVASPLFAGAGILSSLTGARFIIGLGTGVGYLILATGAWVSGAAAMILASLYLRRLARRAEVKGLIKMMTTLVWVAGALIVLWGASVGLSAWVMFARIGVVTVTTTTAPVMPVTSTFSVVLFPLRPGLLRRRPRHPRLRHHRHRRPGLVPPRPRCRARTSRRRPHRTRPFGHDQPVTADAPTCTRFKPPDASRSDTGRPVRRVGRCRRT